MFDFTELLQKRDKIGIWGFGLVGKSVADFFKTSNNIENKTDYTLQVFDQRTLNEQEREYCSKHGISIALTIEDFLKNNDIIIPSPGVNIDCYYEQYKHKWLPELDLFHHCWNKKSIAITGSVGKTSVTTLLSTILQYTYDQTNKKIMVGGNIGIPCLNLIKEQELEILAKNAKEQELVNQKIEHQVIEYAVLEVSSYQLNYTQKFAPDIGIMTNCELNHIDWHKTEENYLKAKLNLFMRQTDKQFAILPLLFRNYIRTLSNIKSICIWFCDSKPTDQELALFFESSKLLEKLFYIHDTCIWLFDKGLHSKIVALSEFPSITFDQNWLVIVAVYYVLNQDLLLSQNLQNTQQITSYVKNLSLPAHRLEKCGLVNGIAIYNDSKSTTVTSTLAAVNQLKNKPILLILGGLSKGVDRQSLIALCKDRVKKVYCFGAESKVLARFCHDFSLSVADTKTLEETVSLAMSEAESGDQLLFSPAGSSYDLFKDYQDRGNAFKKIIEKLQT